jgi:hypothetical protein
MPSAMDGCPATDDVDATTARWDDEDGMECWCGPDVLITHERLVSQLSS